MGTIERCDYAVEATDYEALCLWREWHGEVRWEQEREGVLHTIGRCAGKPVAVTVTWSRINGRRVAFYHASSQVVDHAMVERWVRGELMTPLGTHCDAMNFHRVRDAIRDANHATACEGG
jgi:hypothetical protein